MRFRILLLFILIFFNSRTYAQSLEDVFSTKTMTWYGMDFSMAKLVGDFSGISLANPQNTEHLRDVFFPSCNEVILKEKEKYKLAVFYSKDSVLIDISHVQAINSTINLDSILFSGNPPRLTRGQVQNAILKYDTQGKTGLGLVFMVEALDKNKLLGIIHVIFFDIATRQVLMQQRFEKEPSGFGLRNYWVRTAYDTMEGCQWHWKKWEKTAGIK